MNTKNLTRILIFAVIFTIFRTTLDTGWWLVFDAIAACCCVSLIESIFSKL